MDSFFSISGPVEGEYKEKGSKFLAYGFPVENEEEVHGHLGIIKSLHPKARHYCYAFRLGIDGSLYRTNDDGEPSGTAGKPIFGQLLSSGVSDVLVIVVRYFGGTKLGASGLINAYKSAAANALQNAELVEKILNSSFEITFPVAEMGHVFHVMKSLQVDLQEAIYGEMVCLPFRLRKSEEESSLLHLKALLLKCPIEQAMSVESWSPYTLVKLD